MRKRKLILLLAGATLIGSVTRAQDYQQAKKKPAKGYDKVALTAAEKAEVVADFERALDAQLPVLDVECQAEACAEGCTEACRAKTAQWKKKVAANPTAYYAESFAKRPASWEVLCPLVEQHFTAQATSAKQRAILLDLVAYAPYETSAALSSKLYEANAGAFGQEHVLAFALRGGAPFEKALYEQAKASNSDGGCADIRPAAFFAFHGDPVGKPALVRAHEYAGVAFEQGSLTQPMIAAMALERLGQKGLVADLLARAQDAALTALDEGELKRAKRLALQAAYFGELARSEEGKGKWVELAWMEERVAEHCSAKAPEVASDDAVFELIESVSGM